VSKSAKSELALLSPEQQAAWLAGLEDWALEDIARGEWWFTARPEQKAPPGDWFVWLLLAGRGFGKTRTCAEWLAERALRYPADITGFRTEWLIIAETLTDGLRLCVQGPAGIQRVLERRLGPEKRSIHDGSGKWKLYKGQKPSIQVFGKLDSDGQTMVYGGREEAQVFYIEGADDEDVGRGYNAAGAWLDEFAKWPKPDGSWIEGIAPSLRAELPDGDFPRVVVATTPKLVVQLVEWQDRKDGTVVITSGSTYENSSNLPAQTLAELHKRYHGTRLGRQELGGELIREIEGSMWKLDWIERDRVRPEHLPTLVYRVVAVDPAGTGTRDESGLICTARGADGHDYVIGDWSAQIAGYEAARRAWEMVLAYQAHHLVIETNMAKKWVLDVVKQVYGQMQKEGLFPTGGAAPIKQVHARVGKELRAEPVAARYEQGGRVHHVKGQGLADLETQQISWVPRETKDSPDRVDALVYGELALYDREGESMGAVSPVSKVLPTTSMSPLAASRPV
jgi:phage terminase large subunit-like protein